MNLFNKTQRNKYKNNKNPFAIQSGKFKDGKVDAKYRSDWSEDVYIADSNMKETVGKSFNLNILPFVVFFVVFMVSIIIGRTAWLQIVKGDYYNDMAEGNRVRIQRIEPKRGVIYDVKKRVLARNKANFMLYFIPSDLPSKDEELNLIINEISAIVGDITSEDIGKILSEIDLGSLEAFQPLFIEDNIDYEKAMKLYLSSEDWPGVYVSNKSRREYLYSGIPFNLDNKEKSLSYFMSLSHILGYTGKISREELEEFGEEYTQIDYIGKMGIEYFWENELKGVLGKKFIEVDALGKEKKVLGQSEAVDGSNLVLSLDLEAQLKLEEILLNHLDKLGLPRASAIVMNPNNGEIIALVSLPAYNDNIFARGITQSEYSELIQNPDKPLYSRAVSGEFPSGSTIKPVMLAAALEERVVSENTTFLSTGGLRISSWFFPDWRAGGHGRVDAKTAIAQSVNTYFYYIGGGYDDFVGLGVDRIVDYFKKFGLGSQTGIDLAGEASGFVPTKEWKKEVKDERWYIGDTYHLSIGQGDLLVTPLQVANFTSVFANGGKLYRPHFVKYVLDGEDNLIKNTINEPVREGFIDDYNIMVVRKAMKETIISGSARSLSSIVPVPMAGKTGTAQWSTKKDNHAWFTGFAPYDNPELVITILIEEGGEGSSVAVPIAGEFLKWYFGEYKKQE